MSRVARYLRNRPAAGPFALWHRHAEGGGWTRVDRYGDEGTARDEARAPRSPREVGDLVRLDDRAGRTVGFWVVTSAGAVDAGELPPDFAPFGREWGTAWEGPTADAQEMLRAAAGVDRRRLVLAALDLAGRARHLDPEHAETLAGVLAVGRRWAAGAADAAEVEAWIQRGYDAVGETSEERATWAATAVADALDAAVGDTPHLTAMLVAGNSARALANVPAGEFVADLDGAAVVRRWVPLPVLLLARAGEVVPPAVPP